MPTAFADLILRGGRVCALDSSPVAATAVAITRGRIAAVGDDHDVRDWRGRNTETIDLQGATLTPGLVDGHIHPIWGATQLTAGLDLSRCADLVSLRTALAHAARRSARGAWLRGWGLDPNVFTGVPITSSTVEDVLDGLPAYLILFDGHSALASAAALQRAGIDGPRTFESRSAIVCDESRRPTGHLLEEGAMSLVESIIPAEPEHIRRDRVRRVLHDMAATGLTGGHVMDANGDSLDLLTELDNARELPLRLRVAPWCRPDDTSAQRLALLEQQRRGGRLWQIAAVKLFIDGTIDGGTAWLETPDCHGESTVPYWRDPQSYTNAVKFFAAAGVQTATHAIGDAAVRHVLDTLAGVAPTDGAVRHRIEHIETLPAEHIRRFAELNVIASMQPTHATDYTLADHTDNWSRRLGPGRANRAWPCRDILTAGATLVLGSDWPIAPFDPRLVLAAAQLRRPANKPDLGPVAPDQSLTATQALHAYTTGPAYAAREEHQSGRIAVGYRADLTAFATDPLTTPADELPQTPITLTVVDGQIRHRQ